MRSFHRVKPGDESLVVRSLPEPIINKPISQLFSVDSRRYIGARFCRLERFTHGQNLWFEAKVPRILQQILREKSCKRFNVSTSPPPLEGGLEFFPPPRENFLPKKIRLQSREKSCFWWPRKNSFINSLVDFKEFQEKVEPSTWIIRRQKTS